MTVPVRVWCAALRGHRVRPGRWLTTARPQASVRNPLGHAGRQPTRPTDCLSSAAPCRTINRGISVACANDAVEVGEGNVAEDVLIDRAVYVNSTATTPTRSCGARERRTPCASWPRAPGSTAFAVSGPNPGPRLPAHRRRGASRRALGAAHQPQRFRPAPPGIVVDSIGTFGDWVAHHGQHHRQSRPPTALRMARRRTQLRWRGPPRHSAERPERETEDRRSSCSREQRHAPAGGQHRSQQRLAISPPAGPRSRSTRDRPADGGEPLHRADRSGRRRRRARVWIDGASGVEFFCNEMHGNDGGLSVSGAVTASPRCRTASTVHVRPWVEIARARTRGARQRDDDLLERPGARERRCPRSWTPATTVWAMSPPELPGRRRRHGRLGDRPADVGNFIARTLQPVPPKAPRTAAGRAPPAPTTTRCSRPSTPPRRRPDPDRRGRDPRPLHDDGVRRSRGHRRARCRFPTATSAASRP